MWCGGKWGRERERNQRDDKDDQEAQRPQLQDQSVEKLRLEPRYIYLTVKSVPFQLPEAVQGKACFSMGPVNDPLTFQSHQMDTESPGLPDVSSDLNSCSGYDQTVMQN